MASKVALGPWSLARWVEGKHSVLLGEWWRPLSLQWVQMRTGALKAFDLSTGPWGRDGLTQPNTCNSVHVQMIAHDRRQNENITQSSKDFFKNALPVSLLSIYQKTFSNAAWEWTKKRGRHRLAQLLIQCLHLGFQSYVFKVLETGLVQAQRRGAPAGGGAGQGPEGKLCRGRASAGPEGLRPCTITADRRVEPVWGHTLQGVNGTYDKVLEWDACAFGKKCPKHRKQSFTTRSRKLQMSGNSYSAFLEAQYFRTRANTEHGVHHKW